MMRLFSLALLVVFIAFMLSPRLRGWLRARAPMLALGAIGGAAVFLAITGRLNWIFGAIGAALPVLWRLASVFRFLPLIRRAREQTQSGRGAGSNGGQGGRRNANGAMTQAEAADLLGVALNASREEILSAHRRLMQKLHPDRGGTDYLASQLNAARDCLLKDTRA